MFLSHFLFFLNHGSWEIFVIFFENKYEGSFFKHTKISGIRKPTNAQGFLYYTYQINPTCFGSLLPTSGGYTFLVSYSSFVCASGG
jgi:hypothetical protein